MASGNIPQPMGLNDISVSKGSDDYVNTVNIVAKRFGNIVSCSGYIYLKAGTFTDQITLATLSVGSTDNIYFFDNQQHIMRITGSGKIVYHNSTTFSSGAYIFFNCCYPCN